MEFSRPAKSGQAKHSIKCKFRKRGRGTPVMWRAARRRRPDVVSARLLGSATVDAFAANVRPVIEQIQASGVGSPRDVAKALTAHGVRTARGGSVWTAVQVSTLGRRCARAAESFWPFWPSGHDPRVLERLEPIVFNSERGFFRSFLRIARRRLIAPRASLSAWDGGV